MEIRGYDIEMKGPAPTWAELQAFFLKLWPEAQVQSADDESLVPIGKALPPGNEFFVFQNTAAARAWDEEGGTDQNQETMVHVILGATFVVGSADSEMGKAVASLVENQPLPGLVEES